ncbi:MAG: hypothetical protein ACFE98_08100 [Candidatus Hermodarchaeota archaeon]
MAMEFSVEINAKKIQTLTKVAKLLRDQIQEQNRKIEKLQEEIAKIKENLDKISASKVSPLKEDIDQITSSSIQQKQLQKQPQILEMTQLRKKTSDDKEKLLKALKIIDEL